MHGEYESDQGEFPAAILPAETIKHIEAFKVDSTLRRTTRVIFRIDTAGKTYQIECGGDLRGGKLIDGSFPDYDRAIPKGWEDFKNTYGLEISGFNPRYLADVATAASYIPEEFRFAKSGRPIKIRFEGLHPAVLTEKDPDVLYLLMPMRA